MTHLGTGHIVRGYDRELAQSHCQLLALGGLVEDQIRCATRALLENDMHFIQRVDERAHAIDAQHQAIDAACLRLIALRQPMGRDLRMILTLSRSVVDVSRMGKEAHKIARMTRQIQTDLSRHPPLKLFRDVSSLSQLATTMSRYGLNALARWDVFEAQKVIAQDDELDHLFQNAIRRLTSMMSEDPTTVASGVQMMFATKALERIGDHAKNIADHVIFGVEGSDTQIQTKTVHTTMSDQPASAKYVASSTKSA